MSHITIAQINTAIATTLAAAEGIARTQDGADDGSSDDANLTPLSEGMNDTPTLQVYLESGLADASNEVDRTTFRAGVRQTELVFHADVFGKQRAHIGEDMALIIQLTSAVWDILEAQDVKPYFGLEGIQAFRWTMQRVTFNYASTDYMGARFVITVRVF